MASPSREVSDVDKGVVEGSKDVSHSKDQLPLSHLGTQLNILLLYLLPLPLSHTAIKRI